jgi:hypothetical protein
MFMSVEVWKFYTWVLPVGWISLYVMGVILQLLYGFIEDKSFGNYSVFNKFVMKTFFGYDVRKDNASHPYIQLKTGATSEGILGIVIPICILFMLPTTIAVCVAFPVVIAITAGAISMVFLTRFVRRLSKKLDTHANNKKAHSNSD